MYVIHDKQEQTLLLSGQFDIPLLVNDALFGEDGQLMFENNSGSGLWGNVLLVNGRPWPMMKVQRRTYRFRVLNCSISRSFTWRLSNGMPLQVVATDGVHCYNLPHEDHDMMSQFSVGNSSLNGVDPHHPINAARSRSDPSYRG